MRHLAHRPSMKDSFDIFYHPFNKKRQASQLVAILKQSYEMHMRRNLVNYIVLIALGACPLTMTSCTTDVNGNTAVTPGGAAAIGVGALAAGAIIQNATDNHHHKNRDRRPAPAPRQAPGPQFEPQQGGPGPR